jgi:hypothetical protein
MKTTASNDWSDDHEFNPYEMDIALEQGHCRLLVDRGSPYGAVVAPWHTPPEEVHKFFELAHKQGYVNIVGVGNIEGYKIKDETDIDYWLIRSY